MLLMTFFFPPGRAGFHWEKEGKALFGALHFVLILVVLTATLQDNSSDSHFRDEATRTQTFGNLLRSHSCKWTPLLPAPLPTNKPAHEVCNHEGASAALRSRGKTLLGKIQTGSWE